MLAKHVYPAVFAEGISETVVIDIEPDRATLMIFEEQKQDN